MWHFTCLTRIVNMRLRPGTRDCDTWLRWLPTGNITRKTRRFPGKDSTSCSARHGHDTGLGCARSANSSLRDRRDTWCVCYWAGWNYRRHWRLGDIFFFLFYTVNVCCLNSAGLCIYIPLLVFLAHCSLYLNRTSSSSFSTFDSHL